MKPHFKIKKALNKGIELFNEGELDESLEYLEYAANYGNKQAAHIIGEGCLELLFDDPTWEKAVKYLKLAADKGDSFCQYKIAQCYYDGAGRLEPSTDKFLEYMNKAVKKGQILAIEELADDYFNGGYIAQSYEKAVEYLKKGKKKSFYCKYKLAKCYLDGLGIKKSDTKAFKLFKEIVDSKAYNEDSRLIDALVQLGKCYEKAIGTSKDLQKAIEFYRIAKDYGISGAAERILVIKNILLK